MTVAACLAVAAAAGSSLSNNVSVGFPKHSHQTSLLLPVPSFVVHGAPALAPAPPLCADRLEFKGDHRRHTSSSSSVLADCSAAGGGASVVCRGPTSRRRRRTSKRTVGVMQQQSLGRACAIGAATAVAGACYSAGRCDYTAFGMFQKRRVGAVSLRVCVFTPNPVATTAPRPVWGI